MVLIDNGRLLLMDSEGEIRSVQHLDQGGTPIISLRDLQGTIRSRLFLGEDGTPAVELFNAEGQQVVRAVTSRGPLTGQASGHIRQKPSPSASPPSWVSVGVPSRAAGTLQEG